MKFTDHETEQRFLHRHDDPLSLAGPLARMQRGENPAHHAHAGRLVAYADGFGSRCAAVLPSGVRPTGHAVVGVRRAAVIFVRAGLTETA